MFLLCKCPACHSQAASQAPHLPTAATCTVRSQRAPPMAPNNLLRRDHKFVISRRIGRHHGDACRHRFQNGVRLAFARRRLPQHVGVGQPRRCIFAMAEKMNPLADSIQSGKPFPALPHRSIADNKQMGRDFDRFQLIGRPNEFFQSFVFRERPQADDDFRIRRQIMLSQERRPRQGTGCRRAQPRPGSA